MIIVQESDSSSGHKNSVEIFLANLGGKTGGEIALELRMFFFNVYKETPGIRTRGGGCAGVGRKNDWQRCLFLEGLAMVIIEDQLAGHR